MRKHFARFCLLNKEAIFHIALEYSSRPIFESNSPSEIVIIESLESGKHLLKATRVSI